MMIIVTPNCQIKLDEKIRDEYLEKSLQLLAQIVLDFGQECVETIELSKLEKITLIANADIHSKIRSQQLKIDNLLFFCDQLSTIMDESKYFGSWDGSMYFGDTGKTDENNFWFLDQLAIPYTILTQKQIDERERQDEKNQQKFIQSIKNGITQAEISEEHRKNYLDM
jgi:hypothetical protein